MFTNTHTVYLRFFICGFIYLPVSFWSHDSYGSLQKLSQLSQEALIQLLLPKEVLHFAVHLYT